jgi:hypothetical protein
MTFVRTVGHTTPPGTSLLYVGVSLELVVVVPNQLMSPDNCS